MTITIRMDSLSMDDYEEARRTPKIHIAMEYVDQDEIFNFYIKKISHTPSLISTQIKQSKAVMYVAKGLTRRTWTGRARVINWNELVLHASEPYKTLAVPRCTTTVFNEFFSCSLEKELFHTTILKVLLCDVTKDDYETTIADCDIWIDSHPLDKFREFELPMVISNPDLGELSMALCYLPTSQRMIVSQCRATNLRAEEGDLIHVRASLYVGAEREEIHRTEKKIVQREDAELGIFFDKRMVFDLLRVDVPTTTIIIDVIRNINNKKRVIGQFGVSACQPGCDLIHWRKTVDSLRTPIIETHKLMPGV